MNERLEEGGKLDKRFAELIPLMSDDLKREVLAMIQSLLRKRSPAGGDAPGEANAK